MDFVPLIPRNLSMVLDHNEINQNFTNYALKIRITETFELDSGQSTMNLTSM